MKRKIPDWWCTGEASVHELQFYLIWWLSKVMVWTTKHFKFFLLNMLNEYCLPIIMIWVEGLSIGPNRSQTRVLFSGSYHFSWGRGGFYLWLEVASFFCPHPFCASGESLPPSVDVKNVAPLCFCKKKCVLEFKSSPFSCYDWLR